MTSIHKGFLRLFFHCSVLSAISLLTGIAFPLEITRARRPRIGGGLAYVVLISSLCASALATCTTGVSGKCEIGAGKTYTTLTAWVASSPAAGQTGLVFAGTYAENITIPAGSAGNVITLQANGSDIITIAGTVTLSSHTVVKGNCPALQGTVVTASCGFFFSQPSAPTNACWAFTASLTDFTISNSQLYACATPNIPSTATFGHFNGVTINYTCSTQASPNVCAGIANQGSHMLFENMDISHVSDGFSDFANKFNVIRTTTMHDTPISDCGSNSSNCHIDFMEVEPSIASGTDLFEKNIEINNTGANGHGYLTQGDVCGGNCNQMIIRFHQGAHVGGGCILDDLGGFTGVHSYNVTWADYNSQGFSSGGVCAHWKGGSSGGSALNSIWYFPGSTTNYNPLGCEDISCSPFNHGHNLAFCVGGCGTSGSGLHGFQYGSGLWSDDASNLYADPKFVNYSSGGIGNLALQSTSPARNAGGALTTVNGTISGSSTLVVADAGYFQDGMTNPGVQADCIAVTTISNHVCITAVNYATNTLTLASPISATNGAAVYIYSISDGTVVLTDTTAPDMGALPFNPSPPAPNPGMLL